MRSRSVKRESRVASTAAAPYPRLMGSISIGSAAIKLTDKILGYNSDDLTEILKAIASEIGLSHIAHLRFAADRSSDASLFTAVVTYPREWQTRYFLKQYVAIDPVIRHGRTALLPFDWEVLAGDDPASLGFFADAARHNVGRNGLSIPVRNRKNAYSLVSFTNDAPRPEWESFKRNNMSVLQHLSALIAFRCKHEHKASPASCSLVAEGGTMPYLGGQGKNTSRNSGISGLEPGSVKTHLDTARHKLHCINITHAVGVAVATGVIPATAFRQSLN